MASADSMTTMLKQSEEVVFNAFEQAIAGAASVDVSLVTVIGMTEDGVPLTFTGRRLSDTVKEIEVESMMGMGNEAAIAAWNSATTNRTEFFTSVLGLGSMTGGLGLYMYLCRQTCKSPFSAVSTAIALTK